MQRGTVSAITLCTALAVSSAYAGGVPVFDTAANFIRRLVTGEEYGKTAQNKAANTERDKLADHRQEQLAQIDATISRLTQSSLDPAALESLDGLAAQDVYAIEDNNPYANRLFGDARATIEQMIIETAQKYGGHPALARAGINPTEFRCWFQALVKQESRFSIGAKSPKAAFGLTQIIPDTAKHLGIYPAYYDDPRLQLDGGARYLLAQLEKFGSIQLALAAYNAGPGAVQKHGGIPPYRETQDYVVKISGFYSQYAARMDGVDSLGTLDPADMALAEASNIADAGMHYGMHSSETLVQSMTRLRRIAERAGQTKSAKEALDLNSYARAEVARMAFVLGRLQAAQRRIEAARYASLYAAYARDEAFLQLTGAN